MSSTNWFIKNFKALVLTFSVGFGILVASIVFVGIPVAFNSFLTGKRLEHVTVASVACTTRTDGSARYVLVITNGRPGAVVLGIRSGGIPKGTNGNDARFLKTMEPMSSWSCTLDLPNEALSVDLLCRRNPGRLERKLRGVGARLQLCSAGAQWIVTEKIQLPK